jgi:hypothetical protein
MCHADRFFESTNPAGFLKQAIMDEKFLRLLYFRTGGVFRQDGESYWRRVLGIFTVDRVASNLI